MTAEADTPSTLPLEPSPSLKTELTSHPKPTHTFPHVPPSGVWVPTVTFLHNDELDLESQKKYFTYLSTTGLAGLVVLGTNAETLLLTREERFALLSAARSSVPPNFPIMAGISGHSTKQVLEFAADAYKAGANYVLVLPCAYFGKATTNTVVESFFEDVANGSKLPVVIYNFPVVSNGVDLDSETLTRIAKRNKNIVGVKLTCYSVGKIVRLSATFTPSEFAIFGGQSDFLLGALTVGAAGCIAGFANVFPKTIVKIYNLWKEGKTQEALELHRVAALAESPCKAGIAATKYAVSLYTAVEAGIEGAGERLRPRRPYEEASEATKKGVREAMGIIGVKEKEVAL